MISVTVGAGDTVYRLALKYGVPVAAILAANHIDGAGKIRVGQQLLIPSATTDESDHPLPAIPPALPESTLAIERAKFRLPASQYFQEEFDKDLIVLHFTAGMSAQSASSAWTSTPVQVATPYVVDPDGTIHEFFDPRYWAYHLGVPGSASDGYRHDRRSIPIEIANVGPLKTDPANPKRLNWWPPANPGTGQSEFRTKWCTAGRVGQVRQGELPRVRLFRGVSSRADGERRGLGSLLVEAVLDPPRTAGGGAARKL